MCATVMKLSKGDHLLCTFKYIEIGGGAATACRVYVKL